MGGISSSVAGGILAVALGALAGCAVPAGPAYHFVAGASASDSAHAKIAAWQRRERVAEPAAVADGASLGAEWSRFVTGERRAMAERVRAWIQDEARQRYIPDVGGDHWPTSAEVFASRGDDCDGLELVALHALRALGFPDDTLFRAVIERGRDGVQHMVTLWFESPGDPFVVDPTGFATSRVVRLSALDGWSPRAIFTEQVEYHVEGPALSPASAPE